MVSHKPEDANEHCPGTESAEAGQSEACAGCPNQEACASAPRGPDPAVSLISDRLDAVKRKILVLSGKGGVGKSTVTAMLAWSLAAHSPDCQVGVLDVDVCGPSMPRMLGCQQSSVRQTSMGWTPVYAEENLAVMSIAFLLPDPDAAVIWRGPKKNGIIKQFLRDVEWGPLDVLLIDTPPGTSDEHLSIVQYLKESGIDGAILVTTPQEVSLQDVRKEINFCRKVGLPIIGVVENMAGFVCPHCQECSTLFHAESGGAETMCKQMGVPLLSRIPMDPRVGLACDRGLSFPAQYPDSVVAKAYHSVAQGRLGDTMVPEPALTTSVGV